MTHPCITSVSAFCSRGLKQSTNQSMIDTTRCHTFDVNCIWYLKYAFNYFGATCKIYRHAICGWCSSRSDYISEQSDLRTTLSANKSVKLFYILADSVSQIIWSYTVRIWQFNSAPKGLKQIRCFNFPSLENIRLLPLLAFVLE